MASNTPAGLPCLTSSGQTYGYEPIADEYYSFHHVTSRNFDAATRAFCHGHDFNLPGEGFVLELGAGIGHSREYCAVAQDRIIQTDISYSMLSLTPREESLIRLVCDATCLPFLQDSVSVVTAFLYDPFNVPRLYREVWRVLRKGGVFFGTLPHYDWGRGLRGEGAAQASTTRFVTKSGSTFEAPSHLSTTDDLYEILQSNGFNPLLLGDLCLPEGTSPVSPDIDAPAQSLRMSPYELPIVQLVLARK